MRLLLPAVVLVYAFPAPQRDIAGLIDFGGAGDVNQQPNQGIDSSPDVILEPVTATSVTLIRTKSTAHTTRISISTITTATQSIMEPSTTTTQLVTALATTLAWTIPTSTTTPIVPEAPMTSAEETTQWKVIGIGIITVGLIATVILSIIFFDSWWNFVCALFCGRRRRGRRGFQGEENMVPDWEARDWEFKLANEDGHRYPTMSSLTDIAQVQEARKVHLPSAMALSPKLQAFLLDLDSASRKPNE